MEDDILTKLKKYKDLKYLTERKIEEYNNEILIYDLIIKDLDQLLLNEIKVSLND